MKILIYGAGVIGRIYAAKLYQSGEDVTVLARGKTYEHLAQNGIILNDILNGVQTKSRIPLTLNLSAEDFYNLIIVTVRIDQLDSVKAKLKKNNASKAIMFMLNNPGDPQQLTQEFPDKRIILGFPGAGGTYNANGEIDYLQIKQQKTTIGDIDGKITGFVRDLKMLFERAGFTMAVSRNMESWLKTHAVFIACVSAAIMRENGNSIQLARNKHNVQMMVKSINEGFQAYQKLGISITPSNLKTIFMTMPEWFSVWYWQKELKGKTGTLAIAPHANAAKEEMQILAQNVLNIVNSSSVPTPALYKLLSGFIESD